MTASFCLSSFQGTQGPTGDPGEPGRDGSKVCIHKVLLFTCGLIHQQGLEFKSHFTFLNRASLVNQVRTARTEQR